MRETRLVKSRANSLNRSINNCEKDNLPVRCECSDHFGRELINQTFALNVDYLFECLFARNQFNVNFAKLRKITQTFTGEWKTENNSTHKIRQLEYIVALQGNFLGAKSCKNDVTEKIIKGTSNECYVIESDSFSSGMTYADCFLVRTRFCITKNTFNSSKLLVNAQVVFIQKPIFFIKNIIEKSCISALEEYFRELARCLNLESERLYKQPKNSIDESINSSLSSSPSIISFSEKSNEISDEIESNNSSDKNEAIKVLTNGKKPVEDAVINRSKSFDKSINSLKSKHVKNNKNSHSNESVFYPHNNNDLNHLNKSSSINAQLNSSTTNKSNLCSKCNAENVNVNKPNKKSKSKYFDTDIFLKFFFVIMIFLLILNGVLYIKLKDIENIAINMKKNQKYTSALN